MKTGSLEEAECNHTAWGFSACLLSKWSFGVLLTCQSTSFNQLLVADF